MSIILASALSHLHFHRYTVEQSEHEIFVGPSQTPLLYWLIVLTMAGISHLSHSFFSFLFFSFLRSVLYPFPSLKNLFIGVPHSIRVHPCHCGNVCCCCCFFGYLFIPHAPSSLSRWLCISETVSVSSCLN